MQTANINYSHFDQAPIMLKWETCEGCGRPSAVRTNCTIICDHVADKVAAGMSPRDAVRAHLNPKYTLPEDTVLTAEESTVKKAAQQIKVRAPRSPGEGYTVLTTVNLLDPIAGRRVTKEDLEKLIVKGIKVTVTTGRR